ncbi:claudin [Sarotherodon galilaeus]
MACWRCVICFVFVALTLKSLLSHINTAHSRSPDFRVICGVDGCAEDYRVFNSFYHHLRRTHPQYLATGNPPTGWLTASSDANVLGGENFGTAIFADYTAEPRQTGKRETVDLARCAAAFAIGVREQCHLSQRSVNNIVLGVQQYQTALLTSLRGKIKTILERQPESNGPLQQEVLSTLDNFQDPFPICAASNLQDRVTQMHFNPVTPEEIIISKYACRVKKGESRVLAIKNKSFYYIPLIESLKQLLSNSRLFDMLSAGPQSCPNASFLYDINDGIIFKTHPLFSKKNSALQLILYSDEIEMCNPLGSRASVNKLLMFYYTLGNIDPKFRSKLASIRLLAIAKSRDIDECGVDIILRRINEDLKLLYDGVMINTVNGEFYLNGAVVAVCGDTLAQHELAGFKEGVGFAYSKCRHCECTFDEMQENFNEHSFTRRTLDGHIRQCIEIERATTEFLKSSLKTTFGINRQSKLVDFPGFNLIEQMPQDIMHVILEGVAPMEIKCVLKYLVFSGNLELDLFNSAMQNFPFSSADIRDKPSPISIATLASSDNRLKQSSGQMIILIKILPFLLYSVVEKNPFIQFILDLIEIVKILFAPVVSLQTVSKLKKMIEDHLKQFRQLFPEKNVIPKQHYMLHLPSQIIALGPVIRHMCMRFESKHSFFKQWSSKLNFKNVCKSLVNHNQLLECCQSEAGTEHPIFVNEKELGPVSEVANMDHLQSKVVDFLGIEDAIHHAVRVKWLILHGNKYICDRSLILISANGLNPIFGLVKNIFIVNSVLYCFEYQVYETLGFNKDFLAYEIAIPNLAQATELTNVENLLDFTSYYPVHFRNSVYVMTKYNLEDVLSLKT